MPGSRGRQQSPAGLQQERLSASCAAACGVARWRIFENRAAALTAARLLSGQETQLRLRRWPVLLERSAPAYSSGTLPRRIQRESQCAPVAVLIGRGNTEPA